MSPLAQPKVRPLISEWVQANGDLRLALRDPDELIEGTVFVSPALAPVLELCDGTHSLTAIQAALTIRYGLSLPTDTLESLIQQLDDALLLESERAETARHDARESYRSAPCRPLALAGASYPADPDELTAMLAGFVNTVEPPSSPNQSAVRGIVSPHIDYDRGGPVYARTWQHAQAAAREAEVVVILGTDHAGSPGMLTPTRQDYATPWGTLPTDHDALDRFDTAWGDETLYDEELHHRREHSIELAAVWLHFMRESEPVALVPILCGSFLPFTAGDASPKDNARFTESIAALKKALAGKRVLVVAAADLAHMGPAFGDPQPLDGENKAELEQFDRGLLAAMCQGDAESFLGLLQQSRDKQKVCGLPPIYAALQMLGPVSGQVLDYAQCPADGMGGSVVSVAGAVWTD
ncbi:MAG: AmmeMemoRadiSam system protein B [Chloroflexota bacterium]|nr:AmmeMemoRadiSam system protein B [Chloroflexota bacterium]MDE2839714.1 AmmeMemoRadiSam system protein B [Chloroflexota bacterium]MDE2929540.1 AmmeMemoRadiSam system protein B [Chloroflexota bacterium]